MTYLFSPVGGNDPISSANYHDGSILQICRYYKPDKVILYFSKEMEEINDSKQIDRFAYCFEKLEEKIQKKIEYERIERSDLVDVHEFDFFFKEFSQILKQLEEKYKISEDDTILLNVSSGTPAMKSALLVLPTINESSFECIQVATPNRSRNDQTKKIEDIELLWDLNPDNQEGAQSRCLEVKVPSLRKILYEKIIVEHLKAYSYSAAYEVAKSLAKEADSYIRYLELAVYRNLLDNSKVMKLQNQLGFKALPNLSGNVSKSIEYYLNLDLKQRRGEYSDFIRSLTPLVVDIFEIVLKDCFRVNIDDYTIWIEGKRQWNKSKLNKEYSAGDGLGYRILSKFNQAFNAKFDARFISSVHLMYLVEEFATMEIETKDDSATNTKRNERIYSLVKELRKVEEDIRNCAAHEIMSISNETIKKHTGFSSMQILKKIKELFLSLNTNLPQDVWESYDTMNREIINQIYR